MRRTWLLGFAGRIIIVLGQIGASSAFALSFEPAVFLVSGRNAEGQTVLAEREVLFEDSKLGIGFVCSGMLNGHFEGDEQIVITEVITLSGVKIGELTGEGMLCKSEKGCAENTDLEVWPLGLPGLAIAVLDKENAAPWV